MAEHPYQAAELFPVCRAVLGQDRFGQDRWAKVMAALGDQGREAQEVPRGLAGLGEDLGLPPFLADLARLELALAQAATRDLPGPADLSCLPGFAVNPSLSLLELGWQGLERLLDSPLQAPAPLAGPALLLVWRSPGGEARARPAGPRDLLALKLVVEEISPLEAAGQPPNAEANPAGAAVMLDILDWASRDGLLLKPPSLLVRDQELVTAAGAQDSPQASAPIFTLQWHLTQACDLHCRHCYDRQPRAELTLEQGLAVLDDLEDFCRQRRVRGQITFTGGNPLLSPNFDRLHQEATRRGFPVGVAGNPAPRARLEAILQQAPLSFYQVSLEGLAEHNDHIRGPGHFARTMEFLGILQDLGVYTMVMATLTRANQEQMLQLGALLRGKVDEFNFNRLSLVGEGAALVMPELEGYAGFLETYLAAARTNPQLFLKDNLFNIVLEREGSGLIGGCTGYGCGAAFNFLALLSDGEAHACRKFPSPLGSVPALGLAGVYDSSRARAYRARPAACRRCPLTLVCGGCLASAHSLGLDPLSERDPFCFR